MKKKVLDITNEKLVSVDHIYAIDVSKRALECAAKNCETSKVKFVC